MTSKSAFSTKFKFALLLGVVVSGMTSFSTSAAAADLGSGAGKKVVLTSFGLWGKRVENASIPAALRTRALLQAQGYRVEVCTVPVLWKKSAEMILDCLRTLPEKPDLVVSFGVTGRPEHVVTGARNTQSERFKDSIGLTMKKSKIESNSPNYIPFLLPNNWSLKAAVEQSDRTLPIRKDAGDFICNEVAYRLSPVLSSELVPYFFMHVEDADDRAKQKKLKLTKDQISERTAIRASNLIQTLLSN